MVPMMNEPQPRNEIRAPLAERAIAPTMDFYTSLERLPQSDQDAVRGIWPRLGYLVDEHGDRVVRRGGGYVYRHPDPRIEITYCVNSKTGRVHPTWTAATLKRRILIFLSYSHEDSSWPPKLAKFLTKLERHGQVRHWIDKQIEPGNIWRIEIDEALADSSIAVLLVSEDFLSSKFIAGVELPELLDKFVRARLDLNWIPVRPSTVHETALIKIQALGDPNFPLSGMSEVELERQLVRIFDKLKTIVERHGASFEEPTLPEVGDGD